MARITAELASGLEVRVTNERHQWTADEPVKLGGADAGPGPYEMLLGSLAACTCITLALYCRHKGIGVQAISATCAIERIHADDCQECQNDESGFIDRIETHVHIEGELTDDQRRRLGQVARRCPVHKTLGRGVVFADHATFG